MTRSQRSVGRTPGTKGPGFHLFDGWPVPVVAKDPRGRVAYANDATLRFLDMPVDRVVGTRPPYPWSGGNADTPIGRAPAQYEIVMPGAGGRSATVHIITSSLDMDGEIYIIEQWIDSSRTHAMETEQRLLEEKCKAIFENSTIAITVTDKEERIVAWNSYTEKLLGMKYDDLMHRGVDSLYPDAEWDMIRTQDVRRKGVQRHIETRMMRKDGSSVEVDLSVNVFRGPDGEVVGSIGFIKDITERKRVESQLTEAELNYRTLFENSAVAVTVTDEDERLVSWNTYTEVLLGRSADELRLMPVEQLYPEDEWRMIRSHNIRQKGIQHHIETKVVRGDGVTTDVDLSLSVYRGADGKVLGSIGIISDISERKRREEQLKLAENGYRTIFENSAVAITLADAEERIVSWNKHTETLLAMDKASLHMRPVKSLYPETDWQMLRSHNIRRKGMQHHIETRMVRGDGSLVEVDLSLSVLRGADGEVSGSIAVIADITERRNAERQAERAEQNYRTIFENSAVAITVTDEADRIVSWNRHAESLLRMDKDGLYLKAVEDLYPAEEWRMIRARDIRRKGMQHHIETRMFTGEGETIDVDLSVCILKGVDGEVVGSIGIISDITERKRAEAELKRYQEHLEDLVAERTAELRSVNERLQREIEERRKAEDEKRGMERQVQLAGRLAAVGELAAGVAHELNNPLASIQVYSELLLENPALSDDARNDVVTIHNEAIRAAKTGRNLLSFARQHQPEKKPISLNEIVEKSLDLHAYRMSVNRIEVSTDMDPELPLTMADEHQMQQVFVNLITNAEQAMTEANGGGTLCIRTERAGESVRVSFADNGPGISAENLDRVFDPFFTTKDVGKGTGLGLSICFGIVQQHGGCIYPASESGKGTTFFVEIPLAHQSSKEHVEASM